MIDFLSWYFFRAPKAQLYFIWHVLRILEDLIGLGVNIRFFFAPIFGDKSYFGRIMSFIARTIVIIIGVSVLSTASILLLAIPLAWFLSLAAWIVEPIVLVIPILAIAYYFLYTRKEPTKLYPHKYPTQDLALFAIQEARFFLNSQPDAEYINRLIHTSSTKHFLQRTLLTEPQITELMLTQASVVAIEQQLRSLSDTYHLRQIRPIHVLLAHLLARESDLQTLLLKNKTDLEYFKKYINWDEYEYLLHHYPNLWDEDYLLHTSGGTNVTWQGTVTPVLNQFSRDLSAISMQNTKRVIRHELVSEIEQGLQKNMSASVLMVGDIGVGKDTLVEEIAQGINKGDIKGFLWSKRIVQLDIGRLYAGATEKGAFEQRIENIISEINRSGNIVVYLNDFKSALEITAAGTLSLFSILQEPLSRNKLHLIGSLTPQQFKQIEDKNAAFTKEFTIVHVGEPTYNETTSILFNEALEYETKSPIYLPYPIIEKIYNYAKEYVFDDNFPQKGLRLLEDIVAASRTLRTNTHWNTIYGNRTPILEPLINEVVSKKLNIKVGDTEESEANKLLHLEDAFSQKIVGQTEAVSAVAEILRRNRMGLRNKNKPIGSFLFVGPTGVGKTKMAKVLAEEYYGDEARMIRLDMSEFQNQQSIERLIGSASSNTSYLTLTEQLKRQPFSLVLLDELEKAHPQILDIFLQVLDDGRLTDAYGSTVHCNEAIFIATSNAGTQTITDLFQKNASPDSYEQVNKEIYHILDKYFRVEFLNRFDDIIIFKPLTPGLLRKIVDIELTQIAKQLYNEQKITVTFSPQTIDQVIKKGYNPELGARPLQRVLQDTIESNLARQMLENKIQPGETIQI